MKMPDFHAISIAIAKAARYEVQERKAGEFTLWDGYAIACKLPRREGRDHIQRARAMMMAASPEMYDILDEIVADFETGEYEGTTVRIYRATYDRIVRAMQKARGES
jgi:hypothetical protein